MNQFFDPNLSASTSFEATLRSQFVESTIPHLPWFWYIMGSTVLTSLILIFTNFYIFDYLYFIINI